MYPDKLAQIYQGAHVKHQKKKLETVGLLATTYFASKINIFA